MATGVLRAAFVGAGVVNFGHPSCPWDHATRLEKIPNITVTAIVDIDRRKADQVLQKRRKGRNSQMYDSCQVYDSVEECLHAQTKPDIVFIGIPPGLRGSLESGKDIELQFLRAGVHAFIEKPISLTPSDSFAQYAKAIYEAQANTKSIASVGYMFRYHSAVQKMKELIAANGGKVMSLNARYSNAYTSITSAFWWDEQLGGGAIVEQATHLCDLARYLGGEIDLASIQTTTLRHSDPGGAGVLSSIPPGCEVDLPESRKVSRVTNTQWRYRNGGLGSLSHTVNLHGENYEVTVEVYMDGLMMVLEEIYRDSCRLKVRDAKSDEFVVLDFGTCDPYMDEIVAFVNAARTGNTSGIRSPYEDACKTYEFTRRISSAEKR